MYFYTSNNSQFLLVSGKRLERNRCETFSDFVFFVYMDLAVLIGCFKFWMENGV